MGYHHIYSEWQAADANHSVIENIQNVASVYQEDNNVQGIQSTGISNRANQNPPRIEGPLQRCMIETDSQKISQVNQPIKNLPSETSNKSPLYRTIAPPKPLPAEQVDLINAGE